MNTIKSSRQNMYYIDARDGENIEWSVEVIGQGTIQIFLVKGHCNNFSWLDSEYFVLHSETEDVKEYSDKISAGSIYGNNFTILVLTNEPSDVDYNIRISVYEPSMGEKIFDTIFGMIVIFFFIGGGSVIFAIFKKKRKKKKLEQEAMYKAWGQSDSNNIEPNHAESIPDKCPFCKKSLFYNNLTLKSECSYCGKYKS